MKNNRETGAETKKSSSEKEKNTMDQQPAGTHKDASEEALQDAQEEQQQGRQLQGEEEEGDENRFGGLRGGDNFRKNLGCGG